MPKGCKSRSFRMFSIMAEDQRVYLDIIDMLCVALNDATHEAKSGLRRKEKAAAVAINMCFRLEQALDAAEHQLPAAWRDGLRERNA